MAELKAERKTHRALHAYKDLERATQLLAALAEGFVGSFGLTAIQYGVLETLLLEGAMGQAQLGAKLGRADSNIHYVTSNLEKRGLVIRRINSQDARSTRVHLTPEGKRLAAEVFPPYAKVVQALMSPLDRREQEMLGRLCQKLAEGDSLRLLTGIAKPG
jgi:DNA-binding MarR family transcriptional regulator